MQENMGAVAAVQRVAEHDAAHLRPAFGAALDRAHLHGDVELCAYLTERPIHGAIIARDLLPRWGERLGMRAGLDLRVVEHRAGVEADEYLGFLAGLEVRHDLVVGATDLERAARVSRPPDASRYAWLQPVAQRLPALPAGYVGGCRAL